MQAKSSSEFPYALRRYAHTVGRDNIKFHYVAIGSDQALCGKSVAEFNCILAAGYERVAINAGQVCSRCEAKS